MVGCSAFGNHITIRENSHLLRSVTVQKWLSSLLMNHRRRHALHPSNQLCSRRGAYLQKSMSSIVEQMGLTITIGYHTACGEQSKCRHGIRMVHRGNKKKGIKRKKN